MGFPDAVLQAPPERVQGDEAGLLHQQVGRNPEVQAARRGAIRGGQATNGRPNCLLDGPGVPEEPATEEEGLDEVAEGDGFLPPQRLQGRRQLAAVLPGAQPDPLRIQAAFQVDVAIHPRAWLGAVQSS